MKRNKANGWKSLGKFILFCGFRGELGTSLANRIKHRCCCCCVYTIVFCGFIFISLYAYFVVRSTQFRQPMIWSIAVHHHPGGGYIYGSNMQCAPRIDIKWYYTTPRLQCSSLFCCLFCSYFWHKFEYKTCWCKIVFRVAIDPSAADLNPLWTHHPAISPFFSSSQEELKNKINISITKEHTALWALQTHCNIRTGTKTEKKNHQFWNPKIHSRVWFLECARVLLQSVLVKWKLIKNM